MENNATLAEPKKPISHSLWVALLLLIPLFPVRPSPVLDTKVVEEER